MKPRHNEEQIQLGIALFKKVCSDAVSAKNPAGQTFWSGHQCAGGGATIRQRLNEDTMTPANVARECDLKSILRPAKAAYEAAILTATKKFLGQ
jgi:hypothetical protein